MHDPRRPARLRQSALAALLAAGLAAACAPPAAAQILTTGSGPALAPTRKPGTGSLRADGTLRQSAASVATQPGAAAVELAPSPRIDTSADAATLLADRVVLTGPRSLMAEGEVIIWYHGRRLVASRVSYDGAADRVRVEGPIHLSTPADRGTAREAVLIADSADLDQGLRDGILRGARLVLAREMQMAASAARIEDQGRRVVLDHVVASSCQVCAENPVPLWEIRARRITHDREARQIHFDQPQLRAFGVPVAALPWLTTPDPTVERMSGFLAPRFRTTSGLGAGIKLPYFLTLGDSADLTLTPYVSASRTTTLEARYRQAFRRGEVMFDGAISRDDLVPGKTRGYLFGAGTFYLRGDWLLEAQLQTTSSRAYLLDYGITDADRLWSGATLSRIRRDELSWARLGQYRTLRETEDRATTPAQVADAYWQRRFSPRGLGGIAVLEWSAHGHRRPSHDDITGRDMARASFAASWQRDAVLAGGLLAEARARLDAEFYHIAHDARHEGTTARVTPSAALTLRWPLVRGERGGASQVLEPIAQLVWSPELREADDIPNEDSVLWEFDEGNLFSISRYPGRDARESGLRATVGLGWTRFDPQGWSLALAAGRVFRREAMLPPDGSPAPVFGQAQSDWLLAANFSNDAGLALAGRALIGDSASVSRAELRAGILQPQLRLTAGYLWIDGASEPGLGRDISELVLETGAQLAPGWWATAETRYDFAENRAQKAALGLSWRNECVTLDMGVERRFTAADSLRPETSFDLSIRLGGFGQSSGDALPGTVARRSCLR